MKQETRGRRSPCAIGDRGSSAVEFALVLPLLLLVLLGIIDFGRLEYERIEVTSAAFEGARASGQKLAASAVDAAVAAGAPGLEVSRTGQTNLSCPSGSAGLDTTITVSRTAGGTPVRFQFYTPFLRALNITVTATGAYRCMG